MSPGSLNLTESRSGSAYRRRRGVALLLAMAALVTMMLLVTTIVRVASNASLIEKRQSFVEEASELADSLAEQLPQLVPPLAPTPHSDPWMNIIDTRAGDMAIRVRGIDLSGRLHVKHLDKSIRFGLPPSLRNVVCEAAGRSGPVLLEEIEIDDEFIPIFPAPLPPPPALDEFDFDEFGDPIWMHAENADLDALDLAGQEDDPLDELVLQRTILSEWLTTVGPASLNVNTCPLDLLREALGESELTAGQECLALREEGKPVSDQIVSRMNTVMQAPSAPGAPGQAAPPDRTRPAARPADEDRLRFTNRSEALGLLIEIRRGVQVCRWWVTMEQSGRGWQLVEKRRTYQ